MPYAKEAKLAAPSQQSATPRPAAPLSLRLSLIFFSTAFLLVLAASGILYKGTLAALQGADDQIIDTRLAATQQLLQAPTLDLAEIKRALNDDNQGPRRTLIRIVATSAPDISLETDAMAQTLPEQLFAEANTLQMPARATLVTETGTIFRTASRLVNVPSLPGDPQALVHAAVDTSLDQQSLAHFRRILFFVIGAALPLCALFSWAIVRRELSPLANISAAARAIDASSIGQRLEFEKLPAELHDLSVQFNAMLARIESAWKNLEHYADTIAHEMRTPINRMRLDCEIALDKAQTEDELRDVVVANLTECERLTRLLNGLLFLARSDSRQTKLATEAVDPAEHIRTVHEFFRADAAERGITFLEELRPTPAITADRDLLKQAIANLVANALRHTPPGGTVAIGSDARNGTVLIYVRDTGPGIGEKDRPHIFDRFYRAGKSRNDDGLGLGLAITKSIAELHGGRINLQSEVGRGATFTLAFPAARASVAASTSS